MGKHSNKRKRESISLESALKAEAQAGIEPQAEVIPTADGFDFIHGELGRVHRLVVRHKLKERVKILETIMKVHQPLMRAMRITQKAFQDGVMEGIRQVAAAEREREQKEAEAKVPQAASYAKEGAYTDEEIARFNATGSYEKDEKAPQVDSSNLQQPANPTEQHGEDACAKAD